MYSNRWSKSRMLVRGMQGNRLQRACLLPYIAATVGIIASVSDALTSVAVGSVKISMHKEAYEQGEDITVKFSGGPGNAADWIRFFPASKSIGPGNGIWLYTNGTKAKGGNARSGSITFANVAIAPGEYDIRFLENNGYKALGEPVRVTITPGPPKWVVSEFRRRHGVVGTAYSGKIVAYVTDRNVTFRKRAGPVWLTVLPDGTIKGEPKPSDVGRNTFTLRVTDSATSLHADATMTIEVFAQGKESVRHLKVMSFNLLGALSVMDNGYRKGLNAIILSDADIIGTQESFHRTIKVYVPEKLASDLGWYYNKAATNSTQGIISRYPIVDSGYDVGEGPHDWRVGRLAHGSKIRLASKPSKDVIVATCHLVSEPYGPYAAYRSGATAASVLAAEKKSDRDEAIAKIMGKKMRGCSPMPTESPSF